MLTISIPQLFAQSAKMSAEQYIIKYKDLAVIEMYRAGVPASITLAQGILESQNGNSRLAKEGNNHFGIKCKSTWTGKTLTADDDAVGECFRAYETVLESYMDHSNFLRENWRYSECFNLERTDYVAWAEGLRKAGYATNPKYNTLLTGIIERYKLNAYDLEPMPSGVVPEYPAKSNDVPVVYAGEGETIEMIAQKNDLNSKKIYRYNDLPKGTVIEPGDIVYLKPKRRKGSEPFHVVNEGENMYDLSQLYGIKLKQLYRKNRMGQDEEPLPGTTVYLQSKRSDKPETISKSEFEKQKIQAPAIKDSVIKKPIQQTKIEPKPEIDANEHAQQTGYHIIKSGDNLYRISEKYHVLVEDLLLWNGITSPDEISVNDKIYLTKEGAISAGKGKTTTPHKPGPKAKVHLVAKGDTSYKICKSYGISSSQLMEWNGLKNLESIREGQKLIVGK